MLTNKPIHPEWLSQTITRFYSWMIVGYIIHVNSDGSYFGERGRG